MLYTTELHYFFDTPGFPTNQAFLLTAQEACQWCLFYEVKLLAPKQGVNERVRSGVFSKDPVKDQLLVAELFQWVVENSEVSDLFAFFMSKSELPLKDGPALFDHHDDTCCWVLDITKQQFKILQTAWKEHQLPEDLFFPSDQLHEEMKVVKLLGFIPFSYGYTYTPLRWKARQNDKGST